ncbi:MAG: MBL fold metallo-hydrolase [Ignavibacteriales bacterium]|nr:MBL fold metallo-hydrolase [Ignavibacteriales bacterium]
MNLLSTCVLGSSSAGNATLVWSSETAILIDCGFTPGYIALQLRKLGLSISDLDAVFVTHIHGDHINNGTVGKLVRERVPIYCPPEIEEHLRKKYYSAAMASRHGFLNSIEKSAIELNQISVRSFEVPHDSEGGCFGYSVSYDAGGRTKKVSVSTDMARPTASIVDHMANSDVIVIESNYDVQMLEASARPIWLKRRIRVDGHLSNDQCGESLMQIIERSEVPPKDIALAHVSQECNTNQIALECTEAALERQGVRGINVSETHPYKPGRTITV